MSMSMATSRLLCLLLVLVVVAGGAAGRRGSDVGWGWKRFIRSPDELEEKVGEEMKNSTRWAVLVAGSYKFENYRHQADVCHAYQILKRGGLKDENIVVFMYDDIANNSLNPRPGIIINSPNGHDVYAGVPKDYVGDDVTVHNLFAVLLGDKKSVKGGSGKVVDSKPNDHIFLYYSDHGGKGSLGMPAGPNLVAKDLNDVLKKKHAMGTYKEMVIYIEACDSGTIFEGLLPKDLNIYVTTASNADDESSFAMYCPEDTTPPAPPEYTTCLGDLYSISWMEDSETHNLKKETLEQQHEKVKKRTSNNNTYSGGSHVMEYGTMSIKPEKVSLYQGFDPATANLPLNSGPLYTKMGGVDQRDVDLIFLQQRYKRSSGSERAEIGKEIRETLTHRQHLENSIKMIGEVLFGPQNGNSIFQSTRGPGLPLVDDWECFKSMARLFEKHCGTLTTYGLKYMGAFANVCNKLVKAEVFEEACIRTCSGKNLGPYESNGKYTV